jgi:NADPH-dependent 2,4-dienoyl-CoA reductase/sulfur reductase-like enzyme
MPINRRNFLKFSGTGGLAAGFAGMPGLAHAAVAKQSKAKVVVVGAGWGGATCAKYLRLWAPDVEVTLIEPSKHFVSCPMSNWVIGGIREMDDLVKRYDNLPKHGVKLVHDMVTDVDADKRIVHTKSGGKFAYDRLVLATGVEFMSHTVDGMPEAEAAGKVVHAFKAGPQTATLRKQLEAMPDGGVFVIASPPPPGRCVSGPYERASLVAQYFKRNKPKSKIIMMDGHIDVVSKGPMFKAAWKEMYPGMIEHRPNNLAVAVNTKTMTLSSEFEDVKADVINIIPPQRAGDLCKKVGVRNDALDRWCAIDYVTFESTAVPKVHVIGDPVLSNMPKSAHVSNNQAKICAAAIVELLAGREPAPVPVIGSTSYSATSDSTAGPIAVVMRYDAKDRVYVRQKGGGADATHSELNFAYNLSWFDNMWADTLG